MLFPVDGSNCGFEGILRRRAGRQQVVKSVQFVCVSSRVFSLEYCKQKERIPVGTKGRSNWRWGPLLPCWGGMIAVVNAFQR